MVQHVDLALGKAHAHDGLDEPLRLEVLEAFGDDGLVQIRACFDCFCPYACRAGGFDLVEDYALVARHGE